MPHIAKLANTFLTAPSANANTFLPTLFLTVPSGNANTFLSLTTLFKQLLLVMPKLL
jgi:hypothetical protein